MIRMAFKLESDGRKESTFWDVPGRGKREHEVTKAGKSFRCFLETSRRPMWAEMSERRVEGKVLGRK